MKVLSHWGYMDDTTRAIFVEMSTEYTIYLWNHPQITAKTISERIGIFPIRLDVGPGLVSFRPCRPIQGAPRG